MLVETAIGVPDGRKDCWIDDWKYLHGEISRKDMEDYVLNGSLMEEYNKPYTGEFFQNQSIMANFSWKLQLDWWTIVLYGLLVS